MFGQQLPEGQMLLFRRKKTLPSVSCEMPELENVTVVPSGLLDNGSSHIVYLPNWSGIITEADDSHDTSW